MRPVGMRLGGTKVSIDPGLNAYLQMDPDNAHRYSDAGDELVVRETLSRQDAEDLRDWLNDYLEG